MGEDIEMDMTITLGDLFGSISAVVVALVAFDFQRRRRNNQLVRNLADDLSARRALRHIEPPRLSPHTEEAMRCRVSVQAAQDRISQIRDEVHPNESLRDYLQSMVFLCVKYKEAVEVRPDRWQFELMELRTGIEENLRHIERVLRLKHGSLPTPGGWELS